MREFRVQGRDSVRWPEFTPEFTPELVMQSTIKKVSKMAVYIFRVAIQLAPEFTPEFTPELLCKKTIKKCQKWQFILYTGVFLKK